MLSDGINNAPIRMERVEKIAVAAVQTRLLGELVFSVFSKKLEAAVANGNTGETEQEELEIVNLAITGPSIIMAQASFAPDPVAGFDVLPWVFLSQSHAEAVAAFAHRVLEQEGGSLIMLGVGHSWGMHVHIKKRD